MVIGTIHSLPASVTINYMKTILAAALACWLGLPVQAAEPAPRPLAITIGSSVRLQMRDKQAIQQFFVSNAGVVRVQVVPDDPTALLVTGLQIGRARITLVGADGQREICLVGR